MGLMAVCFSAGDEEWDDANEQNVLEASEQDNETPAIKPDDDEEEEEEELQRAFSRHSEDYLQDGERSPVQGPDLENQNSLDSAQSNVIRLSRSNTEIRWGLKRTKSPNVPVRRIRRALVG
ncbi:hypothetical protein KPH14_004753 [Odynerus spinipes]|uniref:Uncharacterized protein n=1 Tax=Odynerus spinipes TaxID=1348599 RepID=A0AAD9RNH8_9HYME|nr:hypothetical protein KPH14_004753 [Odynerus spinipes]